jgi:hypothetical protein
MSETQLQHHVEIGPSPKGAADVLAALIKSDRATGASLPGGLPPGVTYQEPRGPDRIPAPATVAREGSAACGALARAEAEKHRATHVGVCRAEGPDGPVHHAFLFAPAGAGELPLVTGPDGKSLGPVDVKRVRDPSRDHGMNCGCHVPAKLYQDAAFSPLGEDEHRAPHLAHAAPAERAAAGEGYQGAPRAHAPETEAGRVAAEVAHLAARAATPPPGHEPRPAAELYHPDAPHPPPRHLEPEHLERLTVEIAGALHTIGGGRNPHPLPEDPPVTTAHAEAARAMVGTLVNAAKATPATEHFDDPERQAQVLAVVPAAEQVETRARMLRAAAQLEHLDASRPEDDFALTVASEIGALLPTVLPAEVGAALGRRRAARAARFAEAAAELAQVGYEPDASLAQALALQVALDDWHVGCPTDGRRPPPPDWPHRPAAPASPPSPEDVALGWYGERRDGAWWLGRRAGWDRGWEFWRARLPQGRHFAWFERFHADPAFRARAEAGESIDGLALADVLAWAQSRAPDVVLAGADPAVAGLARHTRDVGEPGRTAATLAAEYGAQARPGWLAELQAANGGQPASEQAPLAVGTTWDVPRAWWPADWRDPPVGHAGHGGHRGGLGGWGPDLGFMDDPLAVVDADVALGLTPMGAAALQDMANVQAAHAVGAERAAQAGLRAGSYATPLEAAAVRQAGYGYGAPGAPLTAPLAPGLAAPWRGGRQEWREREPWRRGVLPGPERPRGWFGPEVDEYGKPLVVGRSTKGGGAYTWGGPPNGWVPTATWMAGHVARDGRFVPGPVRDVVVAGFLPDRDDFLACRLLTEGAAEPPCPGGWDHRGRDREVRDWVLADALRRYWRDADFRRRVDGGEVVDGWDLPGLHDALDPPLSGWWGRLWGGGWGRPAHWWRRDRTWDRGWAWWERRLPAEGQHREWFRRFHEDPDFRRRAEAGEVVDNLDLAAVLAWARGIVPGSVPDVVLGYGGPVGPYGGTTRRYAPPRFGYRGAPFGPPPVALTPAPAVDQYGNVLDQYGNPVAGPGGGPVMGPYGPMGTPPGGQVPLYGIPPELLDSPMVDASPAGAVGEGLDAARRASRRHGGCPTRRCPGSS